MKMDALALTGKLVRVRQLTQVLHRFGCSIICLIHSVLCRYSDEMDITQKDNLSFKLVVEY